MILPLNPRDFSTEKIEAAILDVLNNHKEDRYLGHRFIIWPVTKALAPEWVANSTGGWSEALANKIKRVLNRMADQGVIEKRRIGWEPGYLLAEKAKAIAEAHDREMQSRQASWEASNDFDAATDRLLESQGLKRDAEGYRFLAHVMDAATASYKLF